MSERLGMALYAACVDFMLRVAALTHSTYRDANAALFFLLWPAVTLALAIVALRQRAELRRLRQPPTP